MNPLPQQLASPLHILPGWLPWIFYLLLAVGACWLVKRYWKRKLPAPVVQPPAISQPQPKPLKIDEAIKAIQKKAAKGSCREALFELSAVMREYVDSVDPGIPVVRMTVLEITLHFKSDEPVSFFRDLQGSLFCAEEPGQRDVKKFCTHASAVAKASADWKRMQ